MDDIIVILAGIATGLGIIAIILLIGFILMCLIVLPIAILKKTCTKKVLR